MFPLGTVLLPGQTLPLHVFEPRYRELVRVCLDGDGTFGVVLIERGSEVGGGDVRAPNVGTVARITGWRRAATDGRRADRAAPRGRHAPHPGASGGSTTTPTLGPRSSPWPDDPGSTVRRPPSPGWWRDRRHAPAGRSPSTASSTSRSPTPRSTSSTTVSPRQLPARGDGPDRGVRPSATARRRHGDRPVAPPGRAPRRRRRRSSRCGLVSTDRRRTGQDGPVACRSSRRRIGSATPTRRGPSASDRCEDPTAAHQRARRSAEGLRHSRRRSTRSRASPSSSASASAAAVVGGLGVFLVAARHPPAAADRDRSARFTGDLNWVPYGITLLVALASIGLAVLAIKRKGSAKA